MEKKLLIRSGDKLVGPLAFPEVQELIRQGELLLDDFAQLEEEQGFRPLREIAEVFPDMRSQIFAASSLDDGLQEALALDDQIRAASTESLRNDAEESGGATQFEKRSSGRDNEAAVSPKEKKQFVLIDRSGKSLGQLTSQEIKQLAAANRLGEAASVRIINTPLIVPLTEFLSPTFSLETLLSYTRKGMGARDLGGQTSNWARALLRTFLIGAGVTGVMFFLFMFFRRELDNVVNRLTERQEIENYLRLQKRRIKRQNRARESLGEKTARPEVQGAEPLIAGLTPFRGREVVIGPLSFDPDEVRACKAKCRLSMFDRDGEMIRVVFFKSAYAPAFSQISGEVYVRGRLSRTGKSLILSAVL